jgi:hypothetical protein
MEEVATVEMDLSPEERSLRDEIARAELVLDEFELELREIDRERDEKAGKRHQYDLLLKVCD